MDEHYLDLKTFRSPDDDKRPNATSLTGVLISPDSHRDFRHRYLSSVIKALNLPGNKIPPLPVIHASKLFPDKDDEVRLAFFEDMVSIVIDFNFKIYRVGFYENKENLAAFGGKKGLLSLCFFEMLCFLETELKEHTIWPVMETDRSNYQDQSFPGMVQNLSYYTHLIGAENMSIDDTNLGELHYTTKKSAYGVLTDCVSYLLEARTRASTGSSVTNFKKLLSAISEKLIPSVQINHIKKLDVAK